MQMNTLVGFSLTVGIGSTLLLDLWSFLLYKVGGITPTNWGIVGRWLWGLRQGQWVADQSAYPPITLVEKVSGLVISLLGRRSLCRVIGMVGGILL